MFEGLKEVAAASVDIENGFIDGIDVFFNPYNGTVSGIGKMSADSVRSLCDGDGLVYCGCIERKTSTSELQKLVKAAIH